MSVWVCFPTKRGFFEAQAIIDMWRRRGYHVAVARDRGDVPLDADIRLWIDKYIGWGDSLNQLARLVFDSDKTCNWIVGAADDIEPDPNHKPDDIAAECDINFGGTFGVMQPTGDRFAGGSIDRICGSPWLGREFCRRMYGGRGPFFPEYRHMFVDEELQEVAKSLDCLWQRPDLVHLHLHFMRESRALTSNAVATPAPAHLVEANTREHWDKYKALFLARKGAGFPGHEPIA
jgi:hypothetical protein